MLMSEAEGMLEAAPGPIRPTPEKGTLPSRRSALQVMLTNIMPLRIIFQFGEVEWSMKPSAASGAVARNDVGSPGRSEAGHPIRGDLGNPALGDVGNLARATDAEVCRVLFVPADAAPRAGAGVHVVDARAVMDVLR